MTRSEQRHHYKCIGSKITLWSRFISRSSHFVHQVLVPALMVTAGHDPILLPSLSEGMEKTVSLNPAQTFAIFWFASVNVTRLCLDPESEQRTHRGVRTLDADGQTVWDQPHPDWMAAGNLWEGQTVNSEETVKMTKYYNMFGYNKTAVPVCVFVYYVQNLSGKNPETF